MEARYCPNCSQVFKAGYCKQCDIEARMEGGLLIFRERGIMKPSEPSEPQIATPIFNQDAAAIELSQKLASEQAPVEAAPASEVQDSLQSMEPDFSGEVKFEAAPILNAVPLAEQAVQDAEASE